VPRTTQPFESVVPSPKSESMNCPNSELASRSWYQSAAAQVFGLLARSVPSMAAQAYSQEYLPGKETAWRRDFMAGQFRRDYLVIDNDSILWIAHKISATPVLQAKGSRRAALIFLMRNRAFADIFVFQRFNIDPDTGIKTLRDGDDLGPDFVLETFREERLQTLTLTRLSRLKEIKDGAVALTEPDPVIHMVAKSPEEIEKARRAYLEKFLKRALNN
jgi:hypothetical protein